ncbi:MAG: GntR family transcriptional regulator [Firmicutes bacterium]|jgi:GntR family transcriptional regulator|nr:GntR family transcriptional regulator [Bacillota bacterium]
MISFYLNMSSGVPPYMQIIKQVKQGLALGTLKHGEQLPTVKAVVGEIAVNPNTVLKAYKQLEVMGIVQLRPGVGTFILADQSEVSPDVYVTIKGELQKWFDKARKSGLDTETIESLFQECLRREGEAAIA